MSTLRRRLVPLVVVAAVTAAACSGSSSPRKDPVVTPPDVTLASIAVLPHPRSVPLGLPIRFTAMGTYSDGSSADLTASVVWRSSSEAIATVSNGAASPGLAATVSMGTRDHRDGAGVRRLRDDDAERHRRAARVRRRRADEPDNPRRHGAPALRARHAHGRVGRRRHREPHLDVRQRRGRDGLAVRPRPGDRRRDGDNHRDRSRQRNDLRHDDDHGDRRPCRARVRDAEPRIRRRAAGPCR